MIALFRLCRSSQALKVDHWPFLLRNQSPTTYLVTSSHLCRRTQLPCGLNTLSGESYCVCVIVRVCVCDCERECVRVCVSVIVRERVCECVCVIVCELETSTMRRPRSNLGCCAHKKQKALMDVWSSIIPVLHIMLPARWLIFIH